MSGQNDLTQGNITSMLLRYAGPFVVSNVLQATYNIADMIIAGHYGGSSYAQSAIGNSSTVINLLSMEEREGKSFLAKYFADHWASEGLRTRIVRHGVDFETNDKKYIRAQRLSDFWELNSAEQIPDIILVEYPSVSSSSLPLAVLKQADFNLLIANACRLWGKNDDINLKSIKEMLGDTPLSLYLNNADREVVESFTGELPPKTPLHSFVSRLSQLGLTAKKAAVK